MNDDTLDDIPDYPIKHNINFKDITNQKFGKLIALRFTRYGLPEYINIP